MPEIDFKPELRRSQNVDINRLRLKKDEKARVVALKKPAYAWVHTLRAPKIVNGVPVKVKRERRGAMVEEFDLDFVARPICLGDLGTLADEGIDPKNCPACAAAKKSPDEVAPPDRRFALNLIRYSTRADGSLTTPFSCSAVVWSFTEKTFGKLVDIATEHGGIEGRDLILTCSNEGFQQFDVVTGGRNYWQGENVRDIVLETYKSNALADLDVACGRNVEAHWLKKDLDSIRERWAIATGTASIADPSSGNLSDGLDSLFDTVTPGVEPAGVPRSGTGDVDALLGTTPAEEGPAPSMQDILARTDSGAAEDPTKINKQTDSTDYSDLLSKL